MAIFYGACLVFGFVVLWATYKHHAQVKKATIFIEANTQDIDKNPLGEKSHKAQHILEKSDTLLRNIRLFDENIAWKILSAFGVFLFVYMLDMALNLHLSQALLGIVGIMAVLVAFLLPQYLQKFIVDTRIQKISRDIPMFVDLLAICVQSGMNIEGAIKFLNENMKQVNKGFAPFLNRIVLKSEISGLESAIIDLQKELPGTEIGMMCATLRQSLKYGSAIYETLMHLSMEIRELELLKTEEAIGKLSAKMSVPLILFFMFPVIIIIAAPGVMKVLEGF
ncbi:hypothetical protein BKH46_05855 [Helicobacter sp. 12S02634-8]|uniref:type II secretion system F family protein n=1 Tax=Helicobacter sp. 12S02634-8 TaxID=1476199 RepID=UPI000BA62CEC|nr:type II secretion system F family protein [Helicobacter sp. 12S02634-8]PAF46960.1 hypothetical protein BKH46_05855 [Helicobacter sp. 12S02634-8]